MYWNNSWFNFFNKKIFLNKTLFFENIFLYLFSDKLFNFFFTHILGKFKKNFFKLILLKRLTKQLQTSDSRVDNKFFKKKKIIRKKTKYNFTKIWFIKYNNYILFTTFVFFYFKIKKKKNTFLSKPFSKKKLNIFWKKKRGINFKKFSFLSSITPHIKF